MKRLLGGARMKWVSTVTKKWIVSVTGLLVIAAASAVMASPQPAHADPVGGTLPNVPVSVKWLNRFTLLDNNGHNYKDGDTYDDTYEYIEEGPFTAPQCANHIIFTYKKPPRGGLDADQRNMNFFYQGAEVNSFSSSFGYQFKTCQVITSSGGQTQEVLTDNTTVAVDGNNGARRITFFNNGQDQIVNIPSGVSFSHKGNFKGVERYFRDDEVTDNTNSCPDIIMLHNAQPTGDGRSLFGGGSGDILGSAMLYAVTKDNSLNGISESYQYITAPNNLQSDTCHIKANDINKAKGGTYGLASYGDNGYDTKFEAAGLDQNTGNTVRGGGKYGDDSFIIFVGSTDNMPKDSSGAVETNPGGNNGTGGNADKTDVPTCKGGSLGWMICPIVDGIQKAIGLLQQIMQAFLLVNPLPINSGPIYDAWANIRNVANIAFVGAFFAIIFSQATSIGISNYGIKRLLPRLVLIAIFTNLSYFICSFLVDIFNILGVGVTDLFAIVNNGAAGTVQVSDTTSAVAGGGIVLVIGWAVGSGNIVEIIPLIVTAFLAFVVMMLMLVLRQAILIFLVVLSPLAFVAGLLPGTQSWFKRWFETFAGLLVMYPLLMALFAAANIASAILSSTSGG